MKYSYDIFGNYGPVKDEKSSQPKTVEKFADVSSADIKQAVKDVYQADVESIRNLSNVATKLQNGSLTVPGPMVTNNLQLATGQWGVNHKGERHSYIVNDDTNFKKLMIVGNNTAGGAREVGIWDNLTVNGNTNISGAVNVANGGRYYGDRHFFNDVEKCGNLRVGCAWGIPGIYSEDAGKDLVLGAASGNVKVNGANLIKSGGNNWNFHTPNDNRRTMYITPSKKYDNMDWNWDKAVTINENGDLSSGTITIKNGTWDDFTKYANNSYIVNDNGRDKKLMIVGNNSAGGQREVGIWDNATVYGKLNVTGNMNVTGAETIISDPENKSFSTNGDPSDSYLRCPDGKVMVGIGFKHNSGNQWYDRTHKKYIICR